jgi:hypothetical protein
MSTASSSEQHSGLPARVGRYRPSGRSELASELMNVSSRARSSLIYSVGASYLVPTAGLLAVLGLTAQTPGGQHEQEEQ